MAQSFPEALSNAIANKAPIISTGLFPIFSKLTQQTVYRQPLRLSTFPIIAR